MRIMHIITRFIRGGAQENTLLTLRGQAAAHDVCLLTGPTAGPEGTLIPDAEALGVQIITAPSLIRAVSPLKDWRAYCELRKQICAWKPDIVHTHSSKAGILGRLAAAGENVPGVVHTIHGLPFHPFQNRFLNAAYIGAEWLAAHFCDKIITVAEAMTAQATAAGIAPQEKFVTVYSGMAVENFTIPSAAEREHARARFGFSAGDLVIGKIARLFTLKGHDYLLDAFAGLIQEFPTARLLIVGGGEWQERLEKRAKALGIAANIVWTGLLHPHEVPETLKAMDCVAHCSLREGLARVIPQALLTGLPVVVFDIDGAREIIERVNPEWLVIPEDISGLRTALSTVLQDLPAAKAQAAAAGETYCRKNFPWQTMTERIDEIYREVLRSDKKSGAEKRI